MKRKYYCIESDCNNEVSRKGVRCKHCATSGERNPMFKLDKKVAFCQFPGCNKKLSKSKCSYCQKHRLLGSRNGNFGKKQTKESNLKRSKKLKGRIFTEEHKRKIGLKHKNKIVSQDTRIKISKSKLKHGKCSKYFPKEKNHCPDCGKEIDYDSKKCKVCSPKSRATIKRYDVFCIDCGKLLSKNASYYGYVRCNECAGRINSLGINNPNYIDGRTDLRNRIRYLDEYKQWRKLVFKEDNYTCQECFEKSGDIEAHHIKSFVSILNEFLQQYSQFSPIEDKETLVRLAITYEPFWDVSNGKTLCKKCHNQLKKDYESNKKFKEFNKEKLI